jgi:hypothetical protein
VTPDLDPNVPDEEKLYLRYITSQLRLMGFRDGAPILRVSEGFTLEDLRVNLFSQSDESIMDGLTFRTREGEVINFSTSGVRKFDDAITGAYAADLSGHLFETLPGSDRTPSNQDCYVVTGLLARPETDEVFVPPVMLTKGENFASEDTFGGLAPLGDYMLLQVVALVAFHRDGRFGEALVQCPPSPIDQLLTVPGR